LAGLPIFPFRRLQRRTAARDITAQDIDPDAAYTASMASRPSNVKRSAELGRGVRSELGMCRLTKLRIVEIGVALLLTLAALVFVGLTVWAAEQLSLNVTNAWVRPSVGQSTTTAAYMTIANDGEADDVLKSARSPTVKAVEMHQTTMTAEGVMQMRKLEEGLPIPAGGSVELAPGGAHLMLIGLDEPLRAGDEVTVTLEFAKGAPIEVSVPVTGAQPTTSGKD
jgi:periplasmic copper chaperone A